MKKQFAGFTKIFSFTFGQHMKNKGYKRATIVIALLCLITPALLMFAAESFGNDGVPPADENGATAGAFAGIEDVDRVMAVDLSGDKTIDVSALSAAAAEMTGKDIEIVDLGDDFDTARRATVGSDDALITVTEQEGDEYITNIIIPDGSGISEGAAEGFQAVFDRYTQELALQFQASDTEADESAMGPEEIVAMAASFINAMFIYFFVLVYGQGVANSVVVEKSSKLIETFLISVKPAAMVLGKLLAITATGILQLASWIASLVISFAAGSAIVKSINPDTDMFIINMFDSLKSLLEGMFSPVNCLMAMLMIISGTLLYCALAAIGGALASKAEDVAPASLGFSLVLMVSFFAVMFGGGFSTGEEANVVLDWIPFTAVMITPGKVLLGVLPLWQTLGSFTLILIVTLLAVMLAGKLYKSMILYKGDLPKINEIIKMMKRA